MLTLLNTIKAFCKGFVKVFVVHGLRVDPVTHDI